MQVELDVQNSKAQNKKKNDNKYFERVLKNVIAQPKGKSSGLQADKFSDTSDTISCSTSGKGSECSIDFDPKLSQELGSIMEETKSEEATTFPEEETLVKQPSLRFVRVEVKTCSGKKFLDITPEDNLFALSHKFCVENGLAKPLEEALAFRLCKTSGAIWPKQRVTSFQFSPERNTWAYPYSFPLS